MTSHKTGTRDEWLAARLELLQAEKELTRRGDDLARQRQELPWIPIDKQYRFDTDEGPASLPDLFRGRSQLLVYHFMFGPDYSAGCPACSAIADGFNGFAIHLANHDVMLWAVSRAPLEKLQGYKQRMGWSFPLGRNDGHRLGDLHARAPGHERVRARGRSRLPHVRGVCARTGRPLGHVPVARPGAARAKRGARPRRPTQLVPPPRRVSPRKRGQQVARSGRPARRRTTTQITQYRADQLDQNPYARATRNGGYSHPGLDQPGSLTVIRSRALRGTGSPNRHASDSAPPDSCPRSDKPVLDWPCR